MPYKEQSQSQVAGLACTPGRSLAELHLSVECRTTQRQVGQHLDSGFDWVFQSIAMTKEIKSHSLRRRIRRKRKRVLCRVMRRLCGELSQWFLGKLLTPSRTSTSSLVIDGKFISIYCLFESISALAERVLVTASQHSKAAASGQPGVGVGVGVGVEFGSEVRW